MDCIRKRAPSASSPLVRRLMRNVRRRDTDGEIALRSGLFRAGIRYRLDARPIAGIRCKADIVITSARICVFIDGCYWHGCPRHYRIPKTNAAWWSEKIADNQKRDRRQKRVLRKHGWVVLRFWEHQAKGNTDKCVRLILAAITASRR